MKRVFLETYGCQMNVADSETMAGVLERAGMTLVERAEDADAVLLNTCAIREHAEQRVLGRLGEFARLKQSRPDWWWESRAAWRSTCARGCSTRRACSTWWSARRLPPPARPAAARRRRAGRERAARPRRDLRRSRAQRGSGVRAWITAQRGCDKFCTYCVVPYTRGRERSLPLADLIRQARHAVAQGYREIVYLGQTVNSYHDGTHDFADLLRATDAIEGLLRIRFTSPHPSDMSERVIAAIADCEKVCPQVHLPLQSGSDRILEAMDRTYTLAQYSEIVAKLRAAIPDWPFDRHHRRLHRRDRDDFERTLQVIREVRFDSAFLFKYSARPDTKAFRWQETVSEELKGERLGRLIALQQAISGEINDRWLGRVAEVLVEGRARRNAEQLFGKSAQFKSVVFPDDGTPEGTLRRVRIVGATPLTLFGEPVADSKPAPLVTLGA
jgi:tRNA-2-methylthio-N6-dimethylallyladenosine synthase